ncbi:unnamed protein product, partial [Laminaria digitata]
FIVCGWLYLAWGALNSRRFVVRSNYYSGKSHFCESFSILVVVRSSCRACVRSFTREQNVAEGQKIRSPKPAGTSISLRIGQIFEPLAKSCFLVRKHFSARTCMNFTI